MPTIKIIAGAGLANSRVYLDGRQLTDVVSYGVSADVDNVVQAKVEMLVSEELNLELADAAVEITFKVPEGWQVVEESRPDGSRVFRGEPGPPVDCKPQPPAGAVSALAGGPCGDSTTEALA